MNEKHTDPGIDPFKDPEDLRGTGALCSEAQADGVPCQEMGKECAICGKADIPIPRENAIEDGF